VHVCAVCARARVQRGTAEGARNAKRYSERALVLLVRHVITVLARVVQDYAFERLCGGDDDDNADAHSDANLTVDDHVSDVDDREEEEEEEETDGGVYGFRRGLRAHFASRGRALLERWRETIAREDGACVAPCFHRPMINNFIAAAGFVQSMQPLLLRYERVLDAFDVARRRHLRGLQLKAPST
jgi:hypothetical protein